ncbi:ABC transporter permease [Halocatena pleomorpha]|uniref:ABC transporter permease n=1 Tax=Halocatena pleomorpha TaxID=1785090 RepID=A0A3P3R9D1_9EURY|nr:ABC transporter permease subunit [Halocatena pleomorpha]RRJ30081.1 ABC transporter permease [Halocatena pleomorpha]
MFETARYEWERRFRGTVVIAVGMTILTGFFVWYFSVLDTESLQRMATSLPPAMLEAFGIETIATIEGFLAVEVYNFLWVLGLGLYFAYTAGGLIAGDIERNRMDLLASFPVSRSRLLFDKYGSLLPPIVVFNVAVGLVVYGSVAAIGESIDPIHLLLVHALSIPYLLACAAIGTVFTVLLDRADTAKRGAVGLVFALFLLDSVTANAERLGWVGNLSPTQYYDPSEILVDGTYALTDSGVLLTITVVLLLSSQTIFKRRDI